MDMHSLAITNGPALPAEIIFNISWSKDGRLLTFVALGSNAPEDIWVFDHTANRLWQVSPSPHAGIKLADLVRPELVYFPAHHGLELCAWLSRSHGVTTAGPLMPHFHARPPSPQRP